MFYTDVAIVGAGPAGLAASITAAKTGMTVTLIDESSQAGGQLPKQIHKFFGSKDNYAGIRGFRIGQHMYKEATASGTEIWLDSPVYGIWPNNVLAIMKAGKCTLLRAKKLIIATGASEKPLQFPGWTLPGVMGTGAVQTMVNIHRVLPGNNFLIVGAGNVGMIVAYQLLQAGAEIGFIAEAMPDIGGWQVHADKILRAGVPILTSHSIKEAYGSSEVEGATLVQLNKKWQPIPGTETPVDADTICIAVGLIPLIEIALLAGCKVGYIPELGGYVPLHDEMMQTTNHDIYVAGDASGIEEASVAMEEGRLAATAIAGELGYLSKDQLEDLQSKIRERLLELRSYPLGGKILTAKHRVIMERRNLP
ncbi:MAG: NAD(P)/FAD-dependent oxidoreductase [Candidatus Heimdallarchaeota archaeon]